MFARLGVVFAFVLVNVVADRASAIYYYDDENPEDDYFSYGPFGDPSGPWGRYGIEAGGGGEGSSSEATSDDVAEVVGALMDMGGLDGITDRISGYSVTEQYAALAQAYYTDAVDNLIYGDLGAAMSSAQMGLSYAQSLQYAAGDVQYLGTLSSDLQSLISANGYGMELNLIANGLVVVPSGMVYFAEDGSIVTMTYEQLTGTGP